MILLYSLASNSDRPASDSDRLASRVGADYKLMIDCEE